jgi:type VI protein secretion system component VasF
MLTAGSEGGCREHLNKLNAAAAGLQGLVTGVRVGPQRAAAASFRPAAGSWQMLTGRQPGY